ncbi:MAG: hypothetical protein FJX75_26395 [Armatimonadetes bacterium]|nr:hypothetical protein [Armatimonadota bacterium]
MASLRRSFDRLRREASAGVDGRTVAHHTTELDANLAALGSRVHYADYGVTRDFPWLARLCYDVRRLWYDVLRRRDGRRRPNWARLGTLLEHFRLLRAHITHSRLPKTDSLG